MKIGILTYHFSDNFGAVLQAYALRRWFIANGHDAAFVNYCPAHVEHGGRVRFEFSRRAWKANAKTCYLHYCAVKRRLFGDREQREGFKRFRSVELGVGGYPITNLKDLEREVDLFDMLVCGSDQIWSPSVQHGLDPVYFLHIPSYGGRRISYAASFGNATLSALTECNAEKLLRNLHAISVREESALRLLDSLGMSSARCVVDPTCLHSDYSELVSPNYGCRAPYIYCYALRTDKGVREAAESISASTNWEIVSPQNPHSRWKALGTTVFPCPRQWLSYIANANFVVTNSYHGTVFSVLLRKPFLVVAIPGAKSGLNDRMLSFLSKLGLMHRFVLTVDDGAMRKAMAQEIDWNSVSSELDKLRRESVNFLSEQISVLSGLPSRD